ncbi:MAG: rhomboid family intramembrane serine protease [Acidimicrobiia bacterium]|nr:rhomboid family intramembrane serine protease [Acidimicrobiia bacterium]
MIPLRDSQPSRSTPYVTAALIAVNVAVFLYEVSLEPYSQALFLSQYAMIPARFSLEPMMTSMFLHGGWMHLIGNMWFLWIYGDNVEDVLGHGRYLLFYLLCGVAAAGVHVGFNLISRVPTVGASGAIAGVMGAYLLKFPRAKIVLLVPVFVFITTVEVPAALVLVYWLAIQFFSGVGELGRAHLQQGGVAWFAHIGGFLAGMALIKVMKTHERYRWRKDLHW